MKLKFTLTFALAIGINSINVNAQSNNYLYGDMITNCVARWTFDNNASLIIDSSNNSNNGVLSNVTSTEGWRNLPNSAANFNGYSSKGDIPNSSSFQFQNGSIIALVKFNGFYTGSCQGNNIVSKGGDFTNGSYFFRTTDNSYDNDCYIISPGKQTFESNFYNVDGPYNQLEFLDSNKWYFFAVSYTNGVKKEMYQVVMDTNNYAPPSQTIYYNDASGYQLGSNSDPLNIGYLNGSQPTYWLNGAIDEIAIFNKALTIKDVQNAYTYLWNKGKIENDSNATSVNNLEKKSFVKYHKNQSQYVFSTNDDKQYEAILLDLVGRKLKSFKLKNGTVLELSEFPKQVLILNIYSSTGNQSIKLLN